MEIPAAFCLTDIKVRKRQRKILIEYFPDCGIIEKVLLDTYFKQFLFLCGGVRVVSR